MCILLMRCITGSTFLVGTLFFSPRLIHVLIISLRILLQITIKVVK